MTFFNLFQLILSLVIFFFSLTGLLALLLSPFYINSAQVVMYTLFLIAAICLLASSIREMRER